MNIRILAITSFALCALVSVSPVVGQQAQPAAGEGRAKGAITVRVLGEDGQPVPGAAVSAFQQGSTARVSFDNSGAASGRYVLTNLDPGIYRVAAFAPGYVEESNLTAEADEARNLLRPGDSVTLRMIKGGVITGKVTDADGRPVVGARVAAARVRDAQGRPVRGDSQGREWRTDDRGVYRLYGLRAGSHLVFAGGRSGVSFGARPSAYDADAPTFYPSATRDGAVEVQLQTGQELTGIDIRHRGERGRVVSGTLAGSFAPSDFGSGGAGVSLTHAPSGAAAAFTYVSGAHGRSFAFDSVADGDYDVTALSTSPNQDGGAASPPLRVSVRGADVTGLRLTLAPMPTVAGRLTFEPLAGADARRAECQNLRAPVAQESLVHLRREDGETQASFSAGPREVAPSAGGEFAVRNVQPGRYRIGLRLLEESLFLRSATQGASANPPGAATTNTTAAGARGANDLARTGLNLKWGDRVAGVTLAVGLGAASLRGRVVPASESESLPEGLRVHLVPAERERAEDVLRYAETAVAADGTFALRHLAPGRYHAVVRAAAAEAEQQTAAPPRPLAWDAAARAELRREAEAAKSPVELQPCQRAEDFTLRFARAN